MVPSDIKILANIYPGEILQEEFLIPMGISAYKLSKSIGVQQTRISLIIKGERMPHFDAMQMIEQGERSSIKMPDKKRLK